jgi:hypothetical protein
VVEPHEQRPPAEEEVESTARPISAGEWWGCFGLIVAACASAITAIVLYDSLGVRGAPAVVLGCASGVAISHALWFATHKGLMSWELDE